MNTLKFIQMFLKMEWHPKQPIIYSSCKSSCTSIILKAKNLQLHCLTLQYNSLNNNVSICETERDAFCTHLKARIATTIPRRQRVEFLQTHLHASVPVKLFTSDECERMNTLKLVSSYKLPRSGDECIITSLLLSS